MRRRFLRRCGGDVLSALRRHLDRIEVGRASGREKPPAAMGFQYLGCLRAFVGRQVVEDHDCAGRQRRGEMTFNVNVKSGPIRCATDHPRCNQCVAGQPRDECLGLPATERPHTEQTFANGTSAA